MPTIDVGRGDVPIGPSHQLTPPLPGHRQHLSLTPPRFATPASLALGSHHGDEAVDRRIEVGDGGPAGRCGRRQRHQISAGQRSFGPAGCLQPFGHPLRIGSGDGVSAAPGAPADHLGEIAEVETEVGGAFPPGSHQRLEGLGAVLVHPGSEIGTRVAARGTVMALGYELLDLRRSLGKEPPQTVADALHVAQSRGSDVPCRPQPLRELPAESGLVDRAGRAGVGKHPPAVSGRPGAVRPVGHVGRHHMGMEMRIERPTGQMAKVTGHHSGRRQQPDRSTGCPTDADRLPGEVGAGLGDGGIVSRPGLVGDLPGCQRLQ